MSEIRGNVRIDPSVFRFYYSAVSEMMITTGTNVASVVKTLDNSRVPSFQWPLNQLFYAL